MKPQALTALLLAGYLVAASVAVGVGFQRVTEELEEAMVNEEVRISSIDEGKARTLVNGIKDAYPRNGDKQYAVMCFVPTSLKNPKYNDLKAIKFCTNDARPSENGQTHSEDKLLLQINTLKKKFKNNDTYGKNTYDIFLFSYLSPCPRCAWNIVEAVKGMNNDTLFDGWYISYNDEYEYPKGKSTLQKTKDIINEYNKGGGKPITILPQYLPMKRIV